MTVIPRRNWKQCLCIFFFLGGGGKGERGGKQYAQSVSMKMVNSPFSSSLRPLN